MEKTEVQMKECPRCKNLHVKSGIYCCYSCANSRIHTEETKSKISSAVSIQKKNKPSTEKQKAAARKAMLKMKDNAYERMMTTPTELLSGASRRNRIREEQSNECAICHLTDWLGAKITLELDHINGNNKDNRRENLRALCPNCHAQTPTWRKAKSHPLWKKYSLSSNG